MPLTRLLQVPSLKGEGYKEIKSLFFIVTCVKYVYYPTNLGLDSRVDLQDPILRCPVLRGFILQCSEKYKAYKHRKTFWNKLSTLFIGHTLDHVIR